MIFLRGNVFNWTVALKFGLCAQDRVDSSIFCEIRMIFETLISRAEIFRAFYSQTDLSVANMVGRNTVIRYAESELKSDWSVGIVSLL
jgi:hypothetical protein